MLIPLEIRNVAQKYEKFGSRRTIQLSKNLIIGFTLSLGTNIKLIVPVFQILLVPVEPIRCDNLGVGNY